MLYADEPYSDPQIAFYAGAWFELESCRAIGMAAGPIPWTAVEAWTRHHELDQEATALLWRVVRHVEGEHAEEEENRRTLESLAPPQPHLRSRR